MDNIVTNKTNHCNYNQYVLKTRAKPFSPSSYLNLLLRSSELSDEKPVISIITTV